MIPTPANHKKPSPPLPDVQGLLDTLRTRRERTEADRKIATSVFVAFERLGRMHDVEGLHFYVFEGVVSVYGDVLTHEQREGVLRDLAALPGVRRVADHLRVADRRPRPFTIRPVALEMP
jgi:hypothetical protein